MSNRNKNQKAPFTRTEEVTAQVETAGDTVVVQSPDTVQPDLVEKKPAEVRESVAGVEYEDLPPYYEFMGANLGGQSVYACGICWGTILRDNQDAHTIWHKELRSAR